MDSSCDLCLVSSQATAVFSLCWLSSSNSLKPVLRHLVSLNQCAAHCNFPRFVASRQNNWWYQLRSAYCLTIALACFTTLRGAEEQSMSSSTWVKHRPVILEQIMLCTRQPATSLIFPLLLFNFSSGKFPLPSRNCLLYLPKGVPFCTQEVNQDSKEIC